MSDDLTTRAREVAEGMLILCQNAEGRPVSYSDMAKCAANSDGTCDCSRQVGIIAAFARAEIERARDIPNQLISQFSYDGTGRRELLIGVRDRIAALASAEEQQAAPQDYVQLASETGDKITAQLAAARKALDDEKARCDRVADEMYRSGAKFGWNCCVDDDHDKYAAAFARTKQEATDGL